MDLDHERRLTDVEGLAESNKERISKIEKRQDKLDDLVGSVKLLADREKRVEDDVKEIKSDVKEITGKAGKRWDSIVEKVLLLVVAAFVGFLLSKVGL